MRKLFRYLIWFIKGKPMIKYVGFHCGLCGKWVDKPFEIPDYQSLGEWEDTWGICNKCKNL